VLELRRVAAPYFRKTPLRAATLRFSGYGGWQARVPQVPYLDLGSSTLNFEL
jgi:hypothetical protein